MLLSRCVLGALALCSLRAENLMAAGVAAPSPATSADAEPKISFSSCHVDGQYIAITFDDGPSGANTPRLLDILKERHIKATFFMVGECAARYPQIVQRIAAEGHEIGNHSWSHSLLTSMTDETVRDQLQKTQDAIRKGSGTVPTLLRPPYGGFTARQRRWAKGTFGCTTVLWSVDPEDWKIHDAQHVEDEILKQTKPGAIILSHDIHKSTVDAMPATLDALIGEGYKFVTVSALIAMEREAAAMPKPSTHPAAVPSRP